MFVITVCEGVRKFFTMYDKKPENEEYAISFHGIDREPPLRATSKDAISIKHAGVNTAIIAPLPISLQSRLYCLDVLTVSITD